MLRPDHIRKVVFDRGIEHLLHFTFENNLPSIFAHGLLPRHELEQRDDITAFGSDPYRDDPVRDKTDNGLLLRRDLHAMFDAMLWSIDPKTSKVRLARRLEDKSYRALDGKMIEHHVNVDALLFHFTQFNRADKNV